MFKKIANLGSGACLDSSLSADKNFVVVATVRGIALHDAKTLAKIKHIKIDVSPDKVVLSPNNKTVAYSTNDRRVFLLDLETGHIDELYLENLEIQESAFAIPEAYRSWGFQRFMTNIRALSFSPDGKVLATGNHSAFRSVDFIGIKDKNEIDEILRSQPCYSIVVWDLLQKRIKYTLVMEGEISGLTFSPDSNHLVSLPGMSGLPKLWNLRNGKLICEINHVDYMIRDVHFSPDNLYVGSRGAMEHAITDVQSGKLISKYLFMGEGPDWLINATDLISENAEIRKRLPGYTPEIFSLAISPNNKHLASAGDQSRLNIWDIESTYLANTIEVSFEGDYSNREFVSLDYSPDGTMLITAHTSAIMVWDLITNSMLAEYPDVIGGCGQFSLDGKCLAIGGENLMLSVYEIQDGIINDSALWKRDAFSDGTIVNLFDKKYNLKFSHNSKYIVTGGHDGNIQVWDTRTGELLFKESLREKHFWLEKITPVEINHISFLSDDKRIIYKTAGKLFLLNCENWTKKEIESKTRNFFFNDQFLSTPEGDQLVGSDLNIYNLEDLQIASQVSEDRFARINSITMSKDGKLIAAGGEDGIVYVWEELKAKKKLGNKKK